MKWALFCALFTGCGYHGYQVSDRLAEPVLKVEPHDTHQPYLAVLKWGEGFRLWYSKKEDLAMVSSEDGVRWGEPKVVKKFRKHYDVGLLYEPGSKLNKFKLANWQITPETDNTPNSDAGMWITYSQDGETWGDSFGPVLPSTGDSNTAIGDNVDVFYDSLKNRYGAVVKLCAQKEEGFAPGPKSGKCIRRLVGISWSDDFVHWSIPKRIFVPDEKDEGLLEFYGMAGVHIRNGIYFGFLRVLRDDLPADPSGPVEGIGYTVLGYSKDGETWRRDRKPLLNRNPIPGSFDHAMAWIGGCLPNKSELWCYYGGYREGHKIGSREVGLVKLKPF